MDDAINRKVNVTLTIRQLTEAMLCMRQVRMQYERERESWAKLSLEKNPDGTPTYKNAKRNVEYFDWKLSKIQKNRKLLDGKTREEEQA